MGHVGVDPCEDFIRIQFLSNCYKMASKFLSCLLCESAGHDSNGQSFLPGKLMQWVKPVVCDVLQSVFDCSSIMCVSRVKYGRDLGHVDSAAKYP